MIVFMERVKKLLVLTIMSINFFTDTVECKKIKILFDNPNLNRFYDSRHILVLLCQHSFIIYVQRVHNYFSKLYTTQS